MLAIGEMFTLLGAERFILVVDISDVVQLQPGYRQNTIGIQKTQLALAGCSSFVQPTFLT
jgi:hypothetical protein